LRQSTLKAPEDQIGVVIGSQVVLARSEGAAIVLHVLIGYPDGIAVELSLHLREPAGGRRLANGVRDESRAGRFRIGFAGGEAVDPLPLSTALGSGREVVWYEQMASGSEVSYVSRLWVSPYPAEGNFTVCCAWPEQSIQASSTVLAVPTLEEIEGRAVRLWAAA
jgi:hypothetical protein